MDPDGGKIDATPDRGHGKELVGGIEEFRWCGRRDSNSHALRHVVLSHARLPFRHFRLVFYSTLRSVRRQMAARSRRKTSQHNSPRSGLIVAQFRRPGPAETAARALTSTVSRVSVTLGRAPGIIEDLRSSGMSLSAATRLARWLLHPDSVVLLAGVARGSPATEALGILWKLQAEDVTYVPLAPSRRSGSSKGRTSRSSPNDQSAKASSSTSMQG